MNSPHQSTYRRSLTTASDTKNIEKPCAPIAPLPPEAVAQIKSSTTITSLSQVALELLKNALDNNATKIEITVDFNKGRCIVEDNGLGIEPRAFAEEGGLGKLYNTSKYQAGEEVYGNYGIFLASLGALSLLTVTSRHRSHRSLNALTIHRSRPIIRSIPAPLHHDIKFRDHGTKIAALDLFGNMPVRVKQRANITEESPELDRLWEDLKKEMLGLLLASNRPVSVKVTDAIKSRHVHLNATKLPAKQSQLNGDRIVSPPSSASFNLPLALTLLAQAEYIGWGDWAQWVPVSASAGHVSIKGAVCLTPAPSKRTQFISLGSRPLSPSKGHNDLFNEVNRCFNLSSFGIEEDLSDIDEFEKERRKNDRRFKTGALTNAQMRKGRKGVDRWPMFSLRIALKHVAKDSSENDTLSTESELQPILDILNATITGWLAAHHFRPVGRRRAREPEAGQESQGVASTGENTALSSRGRQDLATGLERPMSALSGRSAPTVSNESDPASQQRLESFQQWSRVKSSNADSLKELWAPSKERFVSEGASPTFLKAPNASKDRSPSPFSFDSLGINGLSTATSAHSCDCHDADDSGALAAPCDATEKTEEDQTSGTCIDTSNVPGSLEDDVITWVEPQTKKKYILNARTGSILVPERQKAESPMSPIVRDRKRLIGQRSKRPALAGSDSNGEIPEFLRNWKNPTFEQAEKQIRRASVIQSEAELNSRFGEKQPFRAKWNVKDAFKDAALDGASFISRDTLRDAQVISQVDKKFILVKLHAELESSTTPQASDATQSILLLIDQHAADERCQVEGLLSELCMPVSDSTTQSSLGRRSRIKTTILTAPISFQVSSADASLFEKDASYFADWGVLYDLQSTSETTGGSSKAALSSKSTVIVTTLPPGIAERCRLDPRLLITFLRSELHQEHRTTRASAPLLGTDSTEHSWLTALSTIPPGLLDMINSRACRSAIMFNDVLDHQQCEHLVQKLASCAFPFQCAHGRPSMVPLVDLGSVVGMESDREANDTAFGSTPLQKPSSDFRKALTKWHSSRCSSRKE